MKVEIKNFQAISHTSFDVSGFTAVVGRSNIGKSAVVRALKCALTGAGGTDFVRHDHKTCDRVIKGNKKCKCFSSVKIAFDDGNVLLWEKGDSKNQYTTWEGGTKQEYTRVGKNPEMPPMLQGFDPIKLGERNRELVQVADQFEGPLFLLNVAGPTVADLLSDVAKLDDINQAMRLVAKDRKEAKATRKVREEDSKAIEAEIKKYRGLDNTAILVVKVQEAQSKMQSLASSTQEATRFLKSLALLAASMRGLKSALEPGLPEESLSKKVGHLKDVAWYLSEYQSQSEAMQLLVSLDAVEVPESPTLQSKIEDLRVASKFLHLYADQKDATKALEGVDDVEVPEVPSVQTALDTLGKIDGWTAHLKEIKATVKGFGALEKLPFREDTPKEFSTLGKIEKLGGYHERLTELERVVSELETGLKEVEGELESMHEAYSEIDFCPVCSQSMPDLQEISA